MFIARHEADAYNLKQMYMNLLTPIPNAEFQLAVACLVLLLIVMFLIYTIKLFNRIEEVRIDMIKEDAEVYREVNKQAINYNKSVEAIGKNLADIKAILNRPLYDIGNTIWYNRGNDGAGGVFENYKGVIVEILTTPNSEPDYLVKSNENESHNIWVSQSLITAWTN